MYLSRPIKEYLEDLSARKPAPGGGSAAALGAALGASLMSMVINYTLGNPKYKKDEPELADMLIKVGRSREELEGLVDLDVEAYVKLSRVMKEPSKDAGKLDLAFKAAARAPFEVCKIASECLELCERLACIGNKNLVTDTAIAAIMLEGAFFSAKYNVYINLKNIKDTDFIGEMHNILAPLEIELPKLKEEILEKCEEVVSK